MQTTPRGRWRSALPLLLALGICAYGAVIRLNVINARYGPIERPAWARAVARIAPVARYLEPGIYAWPPVANPYVGGDPASYLKFAREMRSFYQAHVREPVFLAITRGFLWLLDGQDVGISFASTTMSTLTIFATYLLGRALFSPTVGLLAALGFAIDYDAVSWAADGWRDDTFTCLLIFGVLAIVRMREHPTVPRAIVAGAMGAAACLTRITSVTWLAPAFIVAAIGYRGDRRRQFEAAAIAAVVTALLVAPYLYNCAREFGDPLIAINVHTVYYRAGEGVEYQKPESAVHYIASKITQRPLLQTDVALTGLFVWPMQNKWSGFNLWLPHLATVLETAAVIGLLLFLTTSDGRLLLLVIVSSLAPYALTWNIAGGGEWRFTMHVYPLYLLAAFYAFERVALGAWALRDPAAVRRSWPWQRAGAAAAIATFATLVYLGYQALPYVVQRELLRDGEPVTISTGDRDWTFYTSGWSDWHRDGAVISRVILGDRASVRFALPERRSYRLTIRIDPATPAAPHEVTLLLNGALFHRFQLEWDPQRVGSYSVDVPETLVRPGRTVLTLVADTVLPAGDAGERYAWIPPSKPISLRVWYVRIHPL